MYRGGDYTYVHEDYSGGGDDQIGVAGSVAECEEEIDRAISVLIS